MYNKQEIAKLLASSMGLREWEKRYQPIKKHFSNSPKQSLFESSSEEVEYISQQDPRHVWTWSQGDFADLVVAGYTAGLGHYLTEIPWEKDSDYALLSVEVECECYKQESYENNELGDPACVVCEGYGFVTKHVD